MSQLTAFTPRPGPGPDVEAAAVGKSPATPATRPLGDAIDVTALTLLMAELRDLLPLLAGLHDTLPLTVDIKGLAALLSCSVPSLHRDDAAARIPRARKWGGRKRWLLRDIVLWLELGCPDRKQFELYRSRSK